MSGRTTKLSGILASGLLALGALSFAGCPGEDSDNPDGGTSNNGAGGLLGNIAQQCGLECPVAGQGVAAGNASISGYGAIDGFFRSVVNYNTVAAGVSADIDAELNGIQSLFQISDAELSGKTLGAAITAKLDAKYKASVVVNAQPAKCSVDAHVAAEVTAKCQVEAGCKVDPGKPPSFQCMGTCNVDASIEGKCDVNATAHCKLTGPSVDCMGSCSGSCSVMAPSVSCSGNCRGSCSGTCSASGDANGDGVVAQGECVGSCSGMCTGSCEVTGMAAASCQGKCNGSCEYTRPSGMCDVGAEVSCDLNAQASAQCTGRCSGTFEPPTVACDASASCQASAKAEARFQVQCTPPSVEVKVVAKAGGAAQVEVDFLIAELKARLPRLSAAQARAKLASEAGADLSAAGVAAVQATASAAANAKLGFFVTAKIAQCVPNQLNEAKTVITKASTDLKARTDSCASVASAFGMVM